MSLGGRRPAAAPAAHPRRLPAGGCTFAEDPRVWAPAARIIWHADLDPGALRVIAAAAAAGDPESVDPKALLQWLAIAADAQGHEHIVLSDGWRHIRIDVVEGSIARGSPVVLHHRLSGLAGAERKILALRRLLHLCRHRRFAASLFPPNPRIERMLMVLRVHDALIAGASQREIAENVLRPTCLDDVWRGRSDSLRSRVRRLVREAQAMASGGYRSLMIRAVRRQRSSKPIYSTAVAAGAGRRREWPETRVATLLPRVGSPVLAQSELGFFRAADERQAGEWLAGAADTN